MRTLVVILALLVAVGSAFEDVRTHEFIGYDDPLFITDNPPVQTGLTLDGVRWAFTTFHTGLWHPLTWLSHMLDVEVHGQNPAGHLLMNVALHAANTLLLLAAIVALAGRGAFWPAAMAALLWAAHPLRVESVAWAAERKDLLSAFFGLLCLTAYARHARAPSAWRYVAVAASLALGLMAKPTLVTWPFLMLVLDAWPLRRTARPVADPHASQAPSVSATPATTSRLVVEKIPLVLLVIASSILTVIAERAEGTVSSFEHLPLSSRLANALVAIPRYLGATFWPVDLGVLYPLRTDWPAWAIACSAGLIALISAAALLLRRPMPWLLAGWLWFCGTLVPLIGIVQIGSQSIADRYTYLPQIGLMLALAFGLWSLTRAKAMLAVPIALVLAAGLWLQTRHQVAFWVDSATLYARTLAVTRDNWIMHNNLALIAVDRGDLAEASRHQREALRIMPANAMLWGSLGETQTRQGLFAEAMHSFERAIELEPPHLGAMNNLAWLLATLAAPLRDGERAVALAERLRDEADAATPAYAAYLDTLGAAYASVGRFDDAIVAARRAIEIARRTDQAQLADEIADRIAGYHVGQPAS